MQFYHQIDFSAYVILEVVRYIILYFGFGANYLEKAFEDIKRQGYFENNYAQPSGRCIPPAKHLQVQWPIFYLVSVQDLHLKDW